MVHGRSGEERNRRSDSLFVSASGVQYHPCENDKKEQKTENRFP